MTQHVSLPTGVVEEVRIGQLLLRFFIDGPASDASLTMFEVSVPPGAKVPQAHSHDAFDETIYGLEGLLTMTLNGQAIELGPGETLFIPRGAIHRFDNLHAATARMLAVITPGILGASFFRELGALASGGPPDPAAVGAVLLRHGLTPAI
jgi:quercetin dioxygenase-like cupin family protein